MKLWTKQVNSYQRGGKIVFPYIVPLTVFGFLLGLFAFYHLSFNVIIIALFFNWFLFLSIVGFILKNKNIIWLAIFFLFFVLGLSRGLVYEEKIRDPFLEVLIEEKISLVGQVITPPDCRGFYCRFTFQLNDSRSKILVSTRRDNVDFSCGEYIEVKGKLDKPEAFIDDQGKLFAYDKYLAGRGIAYTISFADIRRNYGDSRHYCALLSSVKESLLTGPRKYLPEPHYSYFAGMSLGDRLPEKNRQITSQIGLAHLFVVSGYHLQIIAITLFGLFYFLKPSRRLFLTSVIIFLFIALTGFKFSAWRAGLMAVLAGTLFVFGRSRKSFYILLSVLLILSFLSPPALFYDRGFQLSFLAALGLVLLGGFWKRKVDFLPDSFNLKSNTAAFLAVYSFIFPALILFFGQISIWSWPANIMVVPLAPFIIFSGLLTGLVYIIPPSFLGQILVLGPAIVNYFFLSLVVGFINSFYFLENNLSFKKSIFLLTLLLMMLYILLSRKHLKSLSTIFIRYKKCYNKKL